MAEIILKDKRFEVDEEGFMQKPEEWNEEVAGLFASTEGIEEMTDKHWAVVRFIRSYWLEHDTAPMVRKLCQESGVNLREVYKLFPSGPAKGACKVAGLPKPDGCV
ncbi:MAG TPA: TusE/DsrC/DsvC family sulfur relay protein [Acidobacteriota bacterium]|nr:TusE/DsrC/DsvC family sulfur relay protein [Acidobacteriota bacterium]